MACIEVVRKSSCDSEPAIVAEQSESITHSLTETRKRTPLAPVTNL
jgi:hypothetical protein